MWICSLCPCSGVQPLKACKEQVTACFEGCFFFLQTLLMYMKIWMDKKK